jgi:Holliday junction DNA helicase RuvA
VSILPVEDDVLSALMNLGYQKPAAEKALAAVKRNGEPDFDTLFRGALAALSR